MTLSDVFKLTEFKNKINELEKENALLKIQTNIKLSIKEQSNFDLDQQLHILNTQIINKQKELIISEQNILESNDRFESAEIKYNDLIEKNKKLEDTSTRLNTVNNMAKMKNAESYVKEAKEKKHAANSPHCPKCKSTNIQILDNKKKAFSVGKAVGGAVLTGGIGTIAGFAGKRGKKYHAICLNCRKSFDIKL
ncbi:hypothetical protein ACVPPR_07460 [Dellaglioa sp. L3N]